MVYAASAANAVPLIRDAEIEHTLRTYSDPVFDAAGVKPSSVKIFIVNDKALNAFVAGGANLFIHTGLILAADSPDMLIGVIAHETGHIAGGHLARGGEKLKDAQMGAILSAVLGAAAAVATGKPEAAAAVMSGGQSMVGRNFLAFTRAHEEAADQSALGSLDRLGISAEGLLKIFALLQRHEREHAGSPDPYVLTHPLSASRIEHVRNHVQRSAVPGGQYPRAFDVPHARMIAKLYGFLQPPERTLQKYPVSDKSVPARLARAVAYYKMPDLPRSLAEIDALLAADPKDPFFHELKGQILFENGRVAEALSAYAEAAKLLPGSALMLVDLAKVELAQTGGAHVASAIAHLEKANSIDNTNSFAWRLLATAYGKAGKMGMSFLALAEEASLNNDPDATLKQVEHALAVLKQGTPARQRAHDLKADAIEMQRRKKEAESPF